MKNKKIQLESNIQLNTEEIEIHLQSIEEIKQNEKRIEHFNDQFNRLKEDLAEKENQYEEIRRNDQKNSIDQMQLTIQRLEKKRSEMEWSKIFKKKKINLDRFGHVINRF